MDNGSSHTYTARVTLVTEVGNPPTDDREVADLIATQMGGELDDPVECGGTGLFCGGVTVVGSDADPKTDPFTIISNMALEAKEYLATGAVNLASDLLDGIYCYIDAECR